MNLLFLSKTDKELQALRDQQDADGKLARKEITRRFKCDSKWKAGTSVPGRAASPCCRTSAPKICARFYRWAVLPTSIKATLCFAKYANTVSSMHISSGMATAERNDQA